MKPPTFALEGRSVYVAGHRGMVGSAIVRALNAKAVTVLTTPRELDLREQGPVRDWFAQSRPEVVIVAAARVGGILANDTRPAEFLYDNLMIEANLIEAARQAAATKLLFLGSSCIYPKFALQPIREEALLTGPLETTNEWYAIAKIAGIKLCQAYRRQYGCDFISAMPTNLYGPGDNYDLASSHVLPALIRKTHAAREAQSPAVTVWGSGTPRREFLHVDDLAAACLFLIENYSGPDHVNVGFGDDISILELAELVSRIVGFQGEILLDRDKPDGTPRKLMDSSRLNAMGWSPRIGLAEGIADSYRDFLAGAARI